MIFNKSGVTLSASSANPHLKNIALVVVTLLFLFSGFYKGLVYNPVDLTLASALLLCCILLLYQPKPWVLLQQPLVQAGGLLTIYLGIRIFPYIDDWGVKKFSELVFLGIPAFIAGFIVTRSKEIQQLLLTAFSWVSVPVVGLLFLSKLISAAPVQGLGSGGYQLTGYLLAISLIAATASGRIYLAIIATIGLLANDSLASSLFGLPIAIFIGARRFGARPTLIVLLLLSSVILAYVSVTGTPLIVRRLIDKTHDISANVQAVNFRSILFDADGHISQRPAFTEDQAWERPHLFLEALRVFLNHPIAGQGYGHVSYLGVNTPHNMFLEMLAEAGLIGFTMMVVLWLIAFANTRPIHEISPYAQFVVGALLFLFLTSNVSLYWGNRIIMFFLGLTLWPPSARQR